MTCMLVTLSSSLRLHNFDLVWLIKLAESCDSTLANLWIGSVLILILILVLQSLLKIIDRVRLMGNVSHGMRVCWRDSCNLWQSRQVNTLVLHRIAKILVLYNGMTERLVG